MARNVWPGPDWIPAVIIQRLGPLSYLVETTDHDLWRRHMDQLKQTDLDSRDGPEDVDREQEPEDAFSGFGGGVTNPTAIPGPVTREKLLPQLMLSSQTLLELLLNHRVLLLNRPLLRENLLLLRLDIHRDLDNSRTGIMPGTIKTNYNVFV